jgi:hypothetical protein
MTKPYGHRREKRVPDGRWREEAVEDVGIESVPPCTGSGGRSGGDVPPVDIVTSLSQPPEMGIHQILRTIINDSRRDIKMTPKFLIF